jgi:predicted TPR repeat methyltransferase
VEWQLYPAGTVPEFTQPEFFVRHDWIPPALQLGHAERLELVATMVAELAPATVVDLGAGDGSLLGRLAELGISGHGYDLGAANRDRATRAGRDVRAANIVDDLEKLDLADLIVCTEVVEHLLDPHGWLRRLAAAAGDRLVVLSSPSSETDVDHYEHHAYAWDCDGYRELVEAAGFVVLEHRTVSAGRLEFQAVVIRAEEVR